MKLTQEMIDYCETQPWDEALRQEVYIKVLEEDGDPEDYNLAWLSRIYTNLLNNVHTIAANRLRLIAQNMDDVRQGIGCADTDSADPMDTLMALEEIEKRVEHMSDLLRATFTQLYVVGMSAQEVADKEGVDVNAIYQRVHTIKEQFDGRESKELSGGVHVPSR